jgi:asparagine synthase (glutamine-hydrolysing)
LNCNSSEPTDLDIVTASWEERGEGCLGSLVGDWALSVLNHYERTLVLARDFLGVRSLYYLRTDRYVAWSTILEPLLFGSKEQFGLSEEYLAGWLAGYPAPELTPYRQILAVPPAHSVRITARSARVERFWEFQPHEKSHRKSDSEYEEEFRSLFLNSVHRRVRSSAPVLPQLSGGMDSSAIVCAADRVVAERGATVVETVSYFDDSEPDWNERPFFTAVETHRGRTGFHLDVSSDGQLLPQRGGSFPVTPAHGGKPAKSQVLLAQHIAQGISGCFFREAAATNSPAGRPPGFRSLPIC